MVVSSRSVAPPFALAHFLPQLDLHSVSLYCKGDSYFANRRGCHTRTLHGSKHADVIESNLDDLSDQRDRAFLKGQVEYFRKMAIQWKCTAAQFRLDAGRYRADFVPLTLID